MKTLKDGHIGYNEAIALTITIISSKVFFSYPGQMVREGQTAAWLVVLVSSLTAVLAWLVIARLMGRFPGKSLVEVSEEVAGVIPGTLLSLAFFGFFLALTSIVLREFSETIVGTILPETPISVVASILLAAVLYASYMGLEAVSRACFLISPFIMVALLALIAGVLPFAKLNYMAPFLGPGLSTIIERGAIQSSSFAEILILPLLYPAIRQTSKFTQIGLWTIGISTLIMTGVVVVFKLVFPYPMALDTAYPMYQLARLIYLGRFFQRVEAILFFIWIFGALLSLTISFYTSAVTLARSLHLPVYRPLLFPLIILVFAFSLLAPDYVTSLRIDEEILRSWGWAPAFGLPLLLLSLAWIRGKGVGQGEQTKGK